MQQYTTRIIRICLCCILLNALPLPVYANSKGVYANMNHQQQQLAVEACTAAVWLISVVARRKDMIVKH